MEEAGKLVEQLCTVAGMVLEDVLETAIVARASDGASTRTAVIEAAANDAAALARAAAIIARRYG